MYAFFSFRFFFFIFHLAIANDEKKLYGVQFHPEVDLTTNGKQMIRNFLVEICSFSCSFTMQSRETECIDYIRKFVGNNKVLVRNRKTIQINFGYKVNLINFD